MNVGQVLETHLGWAAKELGKKIQDLLKDNTAQKTKKIKSFLNKIYKSGGQGSNANLSKFSDGEIIELANNLKHGVPMATAVFDGAHETEIKDLLELAELPLTGQTKLIDGRTGTLFNRPVTVGYMYMLLSLIHV